jgi:hypothetical protein
MKANIGSKNFFKEAYTQQGEKCFGFTVNVNNQWCNIYLVGNALKLKDKVQQGVFVNLKTPIAKNMVVSEPSQIVFFDYSNASLQTRSIYFD